jgi:hypothetical protein
MGENGRIERYNYILPRKRERERERAIQSKKASLGLERCLSG